MALQKVGEYVVGDQDSWANDKLDRKKVADYLTPVIASVTQPFTISLHSPYGTGKTSFIQSWQADLRKQGYKTVYFNAWETDFSQDAFFAFMEAVQRELKSQAPNANAAKTIFEKVTEATKKGAGIVGEKALPLILRGLAKKFAGDETVQGFLSLVGQSDESVGELTGALAEEGLKSQRDAEKSRIVFRTDLSETIKSLFDKSTPIEKRKVIVFVDDLDRCRPSYAIQLLESIKHLFSVDGLLFILAVDEPQLARAVTSVYGTGIDATGYLAKFIDWQYSLPKPSSFQMCITLTNKFSLQSVSPLDLSPTILQNGFVSTVALYADAYKISMRELGAIFTLLNLCLRSGTKIPPVLVPVVAAAAILRRSGRDLVERALSDFDTAEELIRDFDRRISGDNPERFRSPESDRTTQLAAFLSSIDRAQTMRATAESMRKEMNRRNSSLNVPLPDLNFTEVDIDRLTRRSNCRAEMAKGWPDARSPMKVALDWLDDAGRLVD